MALSASVEFDEVVKNVSGVLLDLVVVAQDMAIRMQITHALMRKHDEIAKIMPAKRQGAPPKGPTMGAAVDSGVLTVAWLNESLPNDGGAVLYFKRLDIVGAFPNREWSIRKFETTPRIDSVEQGYTSKPCFIWLTP